ncbi:acyltransferase family protein, partial [Aquabacterium sp.]|uniref:acyltransferase family protein n=1 Tax=Aquabacterium sp. TaxID=1872578 RepID=UPI0035B4F907
MNQCCLPPGKILSRKYRGGMNRFVFLDGIRGLAALIVLTRHTYDFWGFKFFHGYLAVDLFFLLSGFVISSAYDRRLDEGAISRTDFVVIRLIRFYPVYLISIAFAGVLAAIDFHDVGRFG